MRAWENRTTKTGPAWHVAASAVARSCRPAQRPIRSGGDRLLNRPRVLAVVCPFNRGLRLRSTRALRVSGLGRDVRDSLPGMRARRQNKRSQPERVRTCSAQRGGAQAPGRILSTGVPRPPPPPPTRTVGSSWLRTHHVATYRHASVELAPDSGAGRAGLDCHDIRRVAILCRIND